MLRLPLKTLALAAVVLAVGVTAATAATYHWTLVKRAHTTGMTNAAFVSATGFAHAKGIAISSKTTVRETFKVSWTANCTKGPQRKTASGSFTSHGIGTKTPIKLVLADPDSCFVDVNAAPAQAGSFYLSVWKR